MQMIDYTILMKLGYKQHTAKGIIKQAKAWLVENGYEFYLNKRCGVVPAYAVEKVIGVQFEGEVR
ncbi:DUF3173 family protein [Streptococcus anginosus]|uniref:DUF3173 family protein n=1 Tax=Streptococcus anginosus TaxID=1328 RepID=UPI001C8B614F|nr:DUF3173 family protein [Streptococcus anginosus]MBX9101076.1 DUF3173 family protein [Streptococcus anginosus]